mmetsp:Transcript_14869/g.47376  ORF Transcript_14869/g.47376 Transcript_14869/m.47376 type:complete len:267 (-) Transcript_14869:943-1743(-)
MDGRETQECDSDTRVAHPSVHDLARSPHGRKRSNLRERENELEHLGVVGRAKAGDRVPSWGSWEAVRVAAWVAPVHNVVQHFGMLVQQRVQESQGGFAIRQPSVVEQRHHASEGWRGGAGAALRQAFVAENEQKVLGLRGHVREPGTAGVVVRARGHSRRRLEVVGHARVLICGALVEVAEPARADVAGHLRALLGAAHGGDPWACGREGGHELALAVGVREGAADASVAGGPEEGEATGAGLLKLCVDASDVIGADAIFVATIAC